MIQRRRSKREILKVITRPKRYSLIEFDKTEYVDKELIDKITLWMGNPPQNPIFPKVENSSKI